MVTTRTPTTAHSVSEIIATVSTIEWERVDNDSKPPIPTLEDLQSFARVTPDATNNVSIITTPYTYLLLDNQAPSSQHLAHIFHEIAAFHGHERIVNINMQEDVDSLGITFSVFPLPPDTPSEVKKSLYYLAPQDFDHVARFILRTAGEPTEQRLQWLHQAYLNAREEDSSLKHPVALTVRAWQTAKPLAREYDRAHPVAIIDRASMGRVRDVILTSDLAEGIGEISSISAPPPTRDQIEMPGMIDTSPLPDVLPLQAIKTEFGGDTTKRGAVAMPIRLFFEALMALEPKETQANIRIELGDLLKYLNPEGKYNRTNHLPYVLSGLHNLSWLRIPYREKPDKPSTEVDWIPVLPRAIPKLNSGDDASIILEVKLPPDSTGGMMVEKDILRLTGKHSSAKFNAYLSACWLIDRYGTIPQGIIDPTKPVEHRDADGYLLTGDGTRIFDSRGKPIINLYKAASQLDREPNPTRERYPILSFDDLTRACFPKGFNLKKKATYRQRALKAWTELEAERIVRIEKHRHGWRIMPSVAHVARYRAVGGIRG